MSQPVSAVQGSVRDPRLAARELLVHAEQVRALYMQLPKSTLGMACGALVVSAAMWSVVPHAVLVGWLLCVLANQSWRLSLYRKYRRVMPPPADAPAWGRWWALGAGISGLVWGSAGVLMFVPDSIGHQAFLIVALFGVTTAALTLITIHAQSFHAFVLPTFLPLIVRLALEGDALHVTTSAACLIVLLVLIAFGRNLNRLLSESLRIRYENIDLIEELTEQKRLAEHARNEAEIATRAKSKFLAAASHDLRQPLHAMGLFAAALSERVHDPGVTAVVDSIAASVEALEALFNELLDISKLDSGVIEPRIAAFALQPMFARLETEFRPTAAEKRLRLAIVPTRAVVTSDPVLLERIVRNLLSNAIRYTMRGGVLVGCRRAGRRVRIEVWDTGVGIPESEREAIFDEFYQLANPERNTRKGLGLGLAIIRRLARLLDHRVTLTSTVGRGSRFAVEVPRGTRASQPVALQDPAESGSGRFDGAVVVVVDDEDSILEGMRVLLGGWGCRVIAAPSLEAVRRKLAVAAAVPALIISDYRLQDGEVGTDAIEALRADHGTAIPAILVTGSTTAEPAGLAERVGAHLLHKPVLASDLRAVLSDMLGPRS